MHAQVILRELTDDLAERNLRIRGAEIAWQGNVTDLVLGVLPLDVELSAVTESGYRTTDDGIRISFGDTKKDVTIDVWFDLTEEIVRDDD